jgi:esterase/lipase superfamily enzyme
MHIEEHRWRSNHLNRDMALKIYGHWGKPFIVFPSSRGRYFDYEGMGMIEAVAGFINGRYPLPGFSVQGKIRPGLDRLLGL